MSIIAIARDNDDIYYGSDTAVVYNSTKFQSGPKWIEYDSWVIGVTGYCRTLNLLEELDDTKTTTISLLIKHLRELLIEDGFKPKDDPDGNSPTVFPFYGIVIDKITKKIYHVGGDFSYTIINDKFFAEGSGADFAMGCAYALVNTDSIDRLKNSILAAIEYDLNCGGYVWIKKI